jgi:hypothetical protein
MSCSTLYRNSTGFPDGSRNTDSIIKHKKVVKFLVNNILKFPDAWSFQDACIFLGFFFSKQTSFMFFRLRVTTKQNKVTGITAIWKIYLAEMLHNSMCRLYSGDSDVIWLSQDVCCWLLWSSNIHYRVLKSPVIVPISWWHKSGPYTDISFFGGLT